MVAVSADPVLVNYVAAHIGGGSQHPAPISCLQRIRTWLGRRLGVEADRR